MTAGFDWTAEAKDHLRALWLEGKSASEIVTDFRTRFACAPPTRNAVLGTAHRMELPPRKSPIRRRPEMEMRRGPQPRIAPPKCGPGIEDLTPRMCRYPHGHPHQPETFFFCGAAVARPGLPYCAEHIERCYTRAGRRDIDGRTAEGKEALAEMVDVIDAPRPSTHAQKLARARHAKRLMFGRAA